MAAGDEKHHSTLLTASTGARQFKLDNTQNTCSIARNEKASQNKRILYEDFDNGYHLRAVLHLLRCSPRTDPYILNRQVQLVVQMARARFGEAIKQTIWRLPRSLVGDSIRFEDALGRRYNLPFVHFQRREMWHPYLLQTFHGLPGDYQIQRQQYRLFHGSSESVIASKGLLGSILDDSPSNSDLKPGAWVSMFVVQTVPSVYMELARCLECNHILGRRTEAAQSIVCGRCKTVFRSCKTCPQENRWSSTDNCESFIMLKHEKRATFLDRTWKAVPSNKKPRDSAQPGGSQYDVDCKQPPTNVGVSELRNVMVDVSQDPSAIANGIEDLLDRYLTASRTPGNPIDPNFTHLRESLALIRDEARHTNKPTYFDIFEDEYTPHADFLFHACEITVHLRHLILMHNSAKPQARISMQNVRWRFSSFTSWVTDHYPTTPTLPVDLPLTNHKLIIVRTLHSVIRYFRVRPQMTILELKHTIGRGGGLPVNRQCLSYNGRNLEDECTLYDYDIGTAHCIEALLSVGEVAQALCDKVSEAPVPVTGGGEKTEAHKVT